MRSEEQIYGTILGFAKSDERIRMVTLEGSRTNIHIPSDDFQDYDITFFVTDMQSFTADDQWLDVFGERLMMQKPEDMELFPAEEKGFSYLMLFYDDVKIDLTLLPLDLLEEYFTWDKLVKILLDKDQRICQPPVPTDIDYHIVCPTARMFDDCCNCPYVGGFRALHDAVSGSLERGRPEVWLSVSSVWRENQRLCGSTKGQLPSEF